MSDRLAELVRQRALVQEHLAWLNREIAAAAEAAKSAPAGPTAARSAAPEATSPSPPLPADIQPAVPLSAPPIAATASAVDPDEIIARYQVAPTAVKQDVRKGCLLYFAGAFVLLGLVVTILYLTIGRRP